MTNSDIIMQISIHQGLMVIQARSRFLDKLNILQISPEAKTFIDAPITCQEIIQAISFLQKGKAAGPDGISVEFNKAFFQQTSTYTRFFIHRHFIRKENTRNNEPGHNNSLTKEGQGSPRMQWVPSNKPALLQLQNSCKNFSTQTGNCHLWSHFCWSNRFYTW